MYLVLSPLTPNTPSFYRCSLLFYLVEQGLKWRGARWSDRHGVFFRFFPENPESRGARRSLVGFSGLTFRTGSLVYLVSLWLSRGGSRSPLGISGVEEDSEREVAPAYPVWS